MFKKWQRIIAAMLVVTFIHQDLIWAQGGAPVWSKPANGAVAKVNKPDENASVSIPKELAATRDAYNASQRTTNHEPRTTIINIQDSHASLSAQESIASILDSLVTNYDLKLVAIEGSSGYIDTSILKTFPDENIRKKTAEHLMKEGKMSAGEFFAITSSKPIALYGIEDKPLYNENLDQFRRIYELNLSLAKDIRALENTIAALKDKIYSEDLKALDNNSILHKDGKIGFTARWGVVERLAKRAGMDTRHSRPVSFPRKRESKLDARLRGHDAGQATGDYPNLSKLIDALKKEKSISFDKANKERDQLIDVLSKRLPKKDLETLVLKSLAFKQGKVSQGEYYVFLQGLAQEEKIEPSPFSDLIAYTDYITLYESIDLAEIFTEVKDYEDAIKEKLFTNDYQRKLDGVSRYVEYIKNLYEIKLTSADIDEYSYPQGRAPLRVPYSAEDVASFIRDASLKYGLTISGDYDLNAIFSNIPIALDFYKTAEERNNTMLANTVKRMTEEGQSVAALITGGFHTKGISELLRQRQTSYLVLLPKFDASKGERPYVAILTNKRAPYESLLKTGEYYIAIGAYFEGIRAGVPHDKLKEHLGDAFKFAAEQFAADKTVKAKNEALRSLVEMWSANYKTYWEKAEKRPGFEPMSCEDFKKLLANLIGEPGGLTDTLSMPRGEKPVFASTQPFTFSFTPKPGDSAPPYTVDATVVTDSFTSDMLIELHRFLSSSESYKPEFSLAPDKPINIMVEHVAVLAKLPGRDVVRLRVSQNDSNFEVNFILYKNGYGLDAYYMDPIERIANRIVEMYRHFNLGGVRSELSAVGLDYDELTDAIHDSMRETIANDIFTIIEKGGDGTVYMNAARDMVVKNLVTSREDLSRCPLPADAYLDASRYFGHIAIKFSLFNDLAVRILDKETGAVSGERFPVAVAQKAVPEFMKPLSGGMYYRGILAEAIEEGDMDMARLFMHELLISMRLMLARGFFDWDAQMDNYGYDPSMGYMASFDMGKILKISGEDYDYRGRWYGRQFLFKLLIIRNAIYDHAKMTQDDALAQELADYFAEKVDKIFGQNNYAIDMKRQGRIAANDMQAIVDEAEEQDDFFEVVRWNLTPGSPHGIPVYYAGFYAARRRAAELVAEYIRFKKPDITRLERIFAAYSFRQMTRDSHYSSLFTRPYLPADIIYMESQVGPYVGIKVRKESAAQIAGDVLVNRRLEGEAISEKQADEIMKAMVRTLLDYYDNTQLAYDTLARAFGLNKDICADDRIEVMSQCSKINNGDLNDHQKKILAEAFGIRDYNNLPTRILVAFDELRERRRFPFAISPNSFAVKRLDDGSLSVELIMLGNLVKKAQENQIVLSMREMLNIPYDIIFQTIIETKGEKFAKLFISRIYFQESGSSELKKQAELTLDRLYATPRTIWKKLSDSLGHPYSHYDGSMHKQNTPPVITVERATEICRTFNRHNVILGFSLNASKKQDPGDPANSDVRKGLQDIGAIFGVSQEKAAHSFEDQYRDEGEMGRIAVQPLYCADKRTLHLKTMVVPGEEPYEFNLCNPRIAAFIADENSFLYQAVRRMNPEYVSLHLSAPMEEREYGTSGRSFEKGITPPLEREEVLRRFIENINTLQRNLKVVGYTKPVLVESLDYREKDARGAYKHITEPSFIREVLDATGAHLLVDCAHLLVSARNMHLDNPNYDYMDYVRQIVNEDTIELVDEVHLVAIPDYPAAGEEAEDRHMPFYTDNAATRDVKRIFRYIIHLRAKLGITKPLVVNFETDVANSYQEMSELADILNGKVPLDYDTVFTLGKDTPGGFLKDFVEQRYAEIEKAHRPDGRPVFNEGYLTSDKTVKQHRIKLHKIPEKNVPEGLELNVLTVDWRKGYRQGSNQKTYYSVNEPHRPTKPPKPCVFCDLPKEERLFNASINGREYIAAVNINPFGKNHILLVSKEPAPQDMAGRTEDVAIFLRSLGPEYQANFNSSGAAASVLHFHAQIMKTKSILRDNIANGVVTRKDVNTAGGVQEAMLEGWPVESKELIGGDAKAIAEIADRDIARLKSENAPYNMILSIDKDGVFTLLEMAGGNESPAKAKESLDPTGTVTFGANDLAGDVVVYDDDTLARIKADPAMLADIMARVTTRGVLSTGVSIRPEPPEVGGEGPGGLEIHIGNMEAVRKAREACDAMIGSLQRMKKSVTSILKEFDFYDTAQKRAADRILATLRQVEADLKRIESGPHGKAVRELFVALPMLEKTGLSGERFLGTITPRSVKDVLANAISEADRLKGGKGGRIKVAPPLYNKQIEVDGRELLFQKLERVLWAQVQLLYDVEADLASGASPDIGEAVKKEAGRRTGRFDMMAGIYEDIVKPIDYSSFTVLSLWQKIAFMWIPLAALYAVIFMHFNGVDIGPYFAGITIAASLLSLVILAHKLVIFYFGAVAMDESRAKKRRLTPMVDIRKEELEHLGEECISNITCEELLSAVPERIRSRIRQTETFRVRDILDEVPEVLTPEEVLERLSFKTRGRLAEEGIDIRDKEAIIAALDENERSRLYAYDAMPLVSVFLPVYKEKNVVSLLMKNIKRLEYPKLEIIVVGEEDDNITIPILYDWKVKGQLPSCLKIVAGHVPGPNLPRQPYQPRTKPRAIQYALKEATGKYMVIYDAEDRPEENQIDKFVHTYTLMELATKGLLARFKSMDGMGLEKALESSGDEYDRKFLDSARRFGFDLDFKAMAKRAGVRKNEAKTDENIGKIRAEFEKINNPAALSGMLDWFNWYKSRTTRWFSAEYQLHFKLHITGLSAVRSAVLLPGTSYFMPLAKFKELGGLDIYNVTEDEHMGVLLWIRGQRTVCVNTVTVEEAIDNLNRGKWIRQRSRWFKGDWHSFLVYLRHPGELIARRGIRGFVDFVCVIGGGALASFLYLWACIMTVFWSIRFVPLIPVVGPKLLSVPVLGDVLGRLAHIAAYDLPRAYEWLPISPEIGGFLLYALPLIAITLAAQFATIVAGPNDEFKLKAAIEDMTSVAEDFETRASQAASEELKEEYLKEARRLRGEAKRTGMGKLTPSEKATIVTAVLFLSIIPPIGLAYICFAAYLYHRYKSGLDSKAVIAMRLRIFATSFGITAYFVNIIFAGWLAVKEILRGQAHLWQLTTHYGHAWEVGMKRIAGIKVADLWENTKTAARFGFFFIPLTAMALSGMFIFIGEGAIVSAGFLRGVGVISGIVAAAYMLTYGIAYVKDARAQKSHVFIAKAASRASWSATAAGLAVWTGIGVAYRLLGYERLGLTAGGIGLALGAYLFLAALRYNDSFIGRMICSVVSKLPFMPAEVYTVSSLGNAVYYSMIGAEFKPNEAKTVPIAVSGVPYHEYDDELISSKVTAERKREILRNISKGMLSEKQIEAFIILADRHPESARLIILHERYKSCFVGMLAILPLMDRWLDPLSWWIHRLNDSRRDARFEAVDQMGSLGDRRAVPALLRSLADDEWIVRWTAARSLRRLGADESVILDGYRRALASPNWQVRYDTIHSMAVFEYERVKADLEPMLSDGVESVRQATLDVLARLHNKAPPGTPQRAVSVDESEEARASLADEVKELVASNGLATILWKGGSPGGHKRGITQDIRGGYYELVYEGREFKPDTYEALVRWGSTGIEKSIANLEGSGVSEEGRRALRGAIASKDGNIFLKWVKERGARDTGKPKNMDELINITESLSYLCEKAKRYIVRRIKSRGGVLSFYDKDGYFRTGPGRGYVRDKLEDIVGDGEDPIMVLLDEERVSEQDFFKIVVIGATNCEKAHSGSLRKRVFLDDHILTPEQKKKPFIFNGVHCASSSELEGEFGIISTPTLGSIKEAIGRYSRVSNIRDSDMILGVTETLDAKTRLRIETALRGLSHRGYRVAIASCGDDNELSDIARRYGVPALLMDVSSEEGITEDFIGRLISAIIEEADVTRRDKDEGKLSGLYQIVITINSVDAGLRMRIAKAVRTILPKLVKFDVDTDIDSALKAHRSATAKAPIDSQTIAEIEGLKEMILERKQDKAIKGIYYREIRGGQIGRKVLATTDATMLNDQYTADNMKQAADNDVPSYVIYGNEADSAEEARALLEASWYKGDLSMVKFIDRREYTYDGLIAKIAADEGASRGDIGIRCGESEPLLAEGEKAGEEKLLVVPEATVGGIKVLAALHSYKLLYDLVTGKGLPPTVKKDEKLGIFMYLPKALPIDYGEEVQTYRNAVNLIRSAA